MKATKNVSIEISDQLREMLVEYLERYPHLSLNAFAKRAGVSGTTLRRVANSSTMPSPHTVLNIVSYICKEKRISKLLTIVDGPVGDLLESCFKKYIFDDERYEYDLDLNELLQDRNYYFIYKMASNIKGVTLKEVIHLMGNIGKTAIMELVKVGVIEEATKGIFHAINKDFSLDLSVARKHLPDLVKFYKPEKVDEGKNLFYSLSESVSDEAIKVIKDIQREAVKKIHTIISDKENHGENHFFVVSLSDTMTI